MKESSSNNGSPSAASLPRVHRLAIIVQEGEDVGVLLQRLHGLDLRVEQHQHLAGHCGLVDDLESDGLASGTVQPSLDPASIQER